MSSEVRRVPLDFTWPLNKTWSGYPMPDRLREDQCPDCENGYSPQAQHLHALWYGNTPFHPAMPLSDDTPAVRERAERNIARAPQYYGSGLHAVEEEAWRLATLFNRQWCHHLGQDEVDALVDAGRLMEFTHLWSHETGWQQKDPPVRPTPAQVNEWSLRGLGHDSINAGVVVRARCERDGFAVACSACQGHGSVEAYPGQRAEAEEWEPTEPPAGEGWQLWETVSEGSPVTPVFETAEGLIDHLQSAMGFRRSAALQLVEDGSTAGSFVQLGGQFYDSAKDADLIAEKSEPFECTPTSEGADRA